jgi:phosphoinositide-3-kinase, regulatory subunit 4
LVGVVLKLYHAVLYDSRSLHLAERKVLADIPNALAYSRVIETDSNGYLVRQFLYNSLYDRISTRPFLEDIEKKWLAYQLLCAVRDCHSRDIYHGDIKTENTLVTSWNWLYLSDFSWYKPVTLPEDNPADFSYFFDTSGRRTCYLAPERFVPASDSLDPEAKVTWAMDIFSTGCVIAELFLETPIFSLSQLFKYREGQYDPVQTHLSRIPDKNVREMIGHMIDLDPTKRYSAEQSLDFWKGQVFPDYFYNFLHQYMEVITHPASARYSSATTNKHVGEADERIDRVYFDFDKLSYFLGYQDDEGSLVSGPNAVGRLGMPLFPVRINIPNNEHYVSAHRQTQREDGTLIFLTLVVASLRHTARAASKLRACDVLLAFAERLTDDAKLDRVLPYLVSLLGDPADVVVMTAIRNITQIVSMVQVVNTANKDLFVEYIFPRLEDAIYASRRGPRSSVLRAVFASCLGTLTSSAERFLNLTTSIGPSGALAGALNDVEGFKDTDFESEQYDVAKQQLDSQVVSFLTALVADEDVFVRRAFLSSVPELCDYLGESGANDLILTHLNTYLNDRDWTLKCALFDALVGLAAYLGSATTEEYILPLMMQSLMDPEEHVIQSILHSLAEIGKLGLLSRASMVEKLRRTSSLLLQRLCRRLSYVSYYSHKQDRTSR